MTALAFDGSPDIHLVTKGHVALADLGQPLNLGRRPAVCSAELTQRLIFQENSVW